MRHQDGPITVPAPQPVSTGGSPFRVVVDGEPEARTYAAEHTALAAGIHAKLLAPWADVRVVQHREWRIEMAWAEYQPDTVPEDPDPGPPAEPEEPARP